MIHTAMPAHLTAPPDTGHEAINQTTWTDRIAKRTAAHLATREIPIARPFIAASSLLGLIGLLASAYLGYVGLTASKVVGCDGGLFNCDHVLTSRWSTVMGIPVSLPAVALYTVVLTAISSLTSSVARRRQIAASVLWCSAVAAAGAAAWFVSLQVFSIGHFCPYCLVVHACGVLLVGLLFWQRPATSSPLRRLVPLGMIASGCLVAVQALSPASDTFRIETYDPALAPIELDPLSDGRSIPDVAELARVWIPDALQSLATSATGISALLFHSVLNDAPNVATRLVPVSGGRQHLDAHKWPVWGKVDAKYMVVEMFDYTCSPCRNTHVALCEAKVTLGNDLSVLTLPVPLHRYCNDAATSSAPERADACEIARLAISVWLADPTQFTAYHDWLFAQTRTAAEARLHAESLVGRERLAEQLRKGTASKYIAKNVLLYKEAGSGTVPKIIMPTTTVVGEVTSGNTIAEMVRQQLGQ